MTTLSALLVLGQAALIGGSWWVARALREDGRPSPRLLWPALGLLLVGAGPELVVGLGAGRAAFADEVGVAGLGTLLVSEVGFSGVAGHRALIAARRRASLRTVAVEKLAAGDAAFAAGTYDTARECFVEQVEAAQGASDEGLIRTGLTRVAWLDYVCARHDDARAAINRAASAGVDEAIGSELVLLAGCLALAGGRLAVARPAIEDAGRLAAAARDASQAALARLAQGCEQYLEGWTDSGRSFVQEHAEAELQTFDRGLAAVLLVALATVARERRNDADAKAFAAAAEPLVAGNTTLAALAAYAAAPEASPWLEKPAAQLARLVAPAPALAAVR